MQLSVPPLRQKKYYLLTSANKTIIGAKTIEFLHDKLISFELIDKTATDLVFQYRLLNQSMQASSLVHHWSSDMEELQSGIVFIADLSGELADIYNFKSLSRRFSAETIPQAMAKYPQAFCETMIEATTPLLENKDRYLQSLVGYSSWRFFFQDLYRKYLPSEESSLNIKNYFGSVDLPLIITQKNESYGNGKFLQHTGTTATLDTKAFRRADFARMLKDLTGVYNIDARLNLEMEEDYTFTKDGSLSIGEMYLQTRVHEWYSVTTAHQLKQLAPEEVEAAGEEIEVSKSAVQ